MAEWRLVPVEPTGRMTLGGAHWEHHAPAKNGPSYASLRRAWPHMLAAAPDPAADEALVGKVARRLYEERVAAINIGSPLDWNALSTPARYPFRAQALAVIALFKGAPDATG